ncbi:MAG TPA: patatin-like phospholipase family protein [Aldersonia sp.]
MTTRQRPGGVAVVVAGAGARGSYEAGVLSVVVPRLRAAGFEAPMFVGTSVGALNAAIFAGFAHLPPADQAQAVLDVWREISVSDVFASPLRGSVGVTARYLGQLAHVPGLRLTGVLDTAPLRRTTMRVFAGSRLRANIAEHRTTLAVVATSGATNRSVVFVDRAGDEALPPLRRRQADRLRTGADRSRAPARLVGHSGGIPCRLRREAVLFTRLVSRRWGTAKRTTQACCGAGRGSGRRRGHPSGG